MELRRALLLFAIVLGLAAIVTSFSRPAGRDDETPSDSSTVQPGTARAGPRPATPRPIRVSFSATEKPRTKPVAANAAATVTVQTERPGEVELQGLGFSGAADRLTPARFEVLESRPGHY